MSNVDATKIAFLENERDELIVQRDQLKEETNVSMTDTVVRSFVFVVFCLFLIYNLCYMLQTNQIYINNI